MSDQKQAPSGYANRVMMTLRAHINKMNQGLITPSLRGYTIRSLKWPGTLQDGKSWRAVCNRCKGEGVIYENWAKEVEWSGKTDCFACPNHQGWFALPQPEQYIEFLNWWVFYMLQEGREKEIYRVMESEIQWISDGDQEDDPWSFIILGFWKGLGGLQNRSWPKEYYARYSRLKEPENRPQEGSYEGNEGEEGFAPNTTSPKALETFQELIKEYDWTWRMADDSRSYNKGEKQEKELLRLYNLMNEEEQRVARTIHNTLAPEGFHILPKEQNKEYMNTPRRPSERAYERNNKKEVTSAPTHLSLSDQVRMPLPGIFGLIQLFFK